MEEQQAETEERFEESLEVGEDDDGAHQLDVEGGGVPEGGLLGVEPEGV